MKTGVELIADERARQISVEGWTPEHDDKHDKEELTAAACCYAMPPDVLAALSEMLGRLWPWDVEWFKPTPHNRVRDLVKAGALIAAEIDRLQRKA
jgi:hypothetical protein